MRTASIPPVRVSPELRAAAEALLREGETLSSFVASAIQDAVSERVAQRAFVARGLASAQKARESGQYVTEDMLLADLDALLAAAASEGGQRE